METYSEFPVTLGDVLVLQRALVAAEERYMTLMGADTQHTWYNLEIARLGVLMGELTAIRKSLEELTS